LAPGICGCGVIDIDSDSDGTADCLDGCGDRASRAAEPRGGGPPDLPRRRLAHRPGRRRPDAPRATASGAP
jgi:hypothetical protein